MSEENLEEIIQEDFEFSPYDLNQVGGFKYGRKK